MDIFWQEIKCSEEQPVSSELTVIQTDGHTGKENCRGKNQTNLKQVCITCPAALSWAATLPASCIWIFSSSMGVVT